MFGLQEETNKLVEALQGAFGVVVSCAVPAREMAGVRNGYQDFERLGLDRWLAMLGGFKLASGACLVLDFGTAATADFIAADGQHLGGFDLPRHAIDAQPVAHAHPQDTLRRRGG